MASALCQHSLQRPQAMSGLELTLSMAIVSGVLMVGSLAVTSDGVSLLRGDLGGGLTAASWLPIVTNSLGGILVGQVTKHMGGVSKGFSIVGGLVVCGAVQVRVERVTNTLPMEASSVSKQALEICMCMTVRVKTWSV